MTEQWFYRAFGEERGPVSLEHLQEMAVKKQLSPQDAIRLDGSENWQEAKSVAAVFPHLQNDAAVEIAEAFDNADFDSLEVADEDASDRMESLDDLGIIVSDAPTLTPESLEDSALESLDELGIEIADGPSSPVAPAKDVNEWFCKMLGHQLGPMPFEDLCLFAKSGKLGLSDEVQKVGELEWRMAKTVDGLFPGFESGKPLEEITDTQLADGVLVLPEDLNQAVADLPDLEPQLSPPKKVPPKKVPPKKVPPKPVPKSEAPVETEPPPAPPEPEAVPELTPQERMNKWLSDAVPVEAPKPPPEETPESATETPAPAAPPKEDRAAQLQREYQARAAMLASQAGQAPKPAKMKSAGPSFGEKFSGLGEQLKSNPKAIGVFAVLILILIVKFVPFSALGGGGNQKYFDQITQWGSTYQQLRTQNPGELSAFTSKTKPEVEAMKAELTKQGAGIQDRPKQEMLWACDMLLTMFGDTSDGEQSEYQKNYDRHVATAKALMNGEPPPVLATESEETTE